MERFMTTKLSTEELRQAIVRLVVTCDLPFRIVESEAVSVPCKNFIPSRWTVSRDTVVYATAALQSAIAEMLAKEGELGCKVSITIDMWTAPNNKAWLVVTGHWIDESFQLRTMVLEFREMLGRHGGREMAQVVEETIVQCTLQLAHALPVSVGVCVGRVCGSVGVCLTTWGSGLVFVARSNHVSSNFPFSLSLMLCSVRRCLAHVINLALQAALAVDSIRKLLKILREMASWIGFSPQRSGSFLGLQRTLNSQANPATPKPALKLVQDSPTRWGSTHDMVERAAVLQNPITVFFAQTQRTLNSQANPATPKPALKLVQDSPTRWGSTHDMVERAAVLQNPITVFFAQTQGLSKTDKKKVESLRLTDADWETLQAVETFLSPFAKVSKAAEGAAYPTVSMVVPYYNGLIDAMESRLAKGPSPTLQPMIVAALSHLKKYAYITSNERVRPRPASGEVIKLMRDRVAEYQARAAELAPRPTPLAPVADEEDGDEAEDDDDAQFLPSHRRLAARLSASQEAGAGGMVQDDERIGEGRRPRGIAPPEFVIEGEGAEEDDEEEEEEGVEADDIAGGEDAVVGSSSGVLV
ncbi:unnamed protein product [Closterium sp. NIES-53]